MGSWFSSLFGSSEKKEEKTPYQGSGGERFKNLILTHFRGLLGFLILCITTAFAGSKANPHRTVYCLWINMFLFFVIQPVNIPVTGMMPVFYLVMFGVMDSTTVCKLYFGPGQALFMMAGMVGLLLNNSKFDRRMMFWFLNPNSPITAKGFMISVSFAAYVTSIFSNKLLVTSYLIELFAPAFNSGEEASTEEFKKYRNIIMNAIQTSSNIGGMAFIHGSLSTLAMKTIYEEGFRFSTFTYFNFLSVFVLSITMFVFNLIYHIILIKVQVKDVHGGCQASIKNAISKGKSELSPKLTAHEIQTIFFFSLALILYITRVTRFGGWQSMFNPLYAPDDTVVAAFIVIITSALPKGTSFIKAMTASKKSEMPPCKPESAIMFWKFVDKNTVYGYLFLIGGGNALNRAVQSQLGMKLPDHIGKIITFAGTDFSYVMVAVISVILVNLMSSVAAVCVFLPLVISAYNFGGGIFDFSLRFGSSRAALTVGLAGSLAFALPYKFNCAYFVHYIGKVPKKKMCVLGAGSAAVCTVPLILFAQGARYVL